MLDVYPAREEPVGELAGVSGLRVAAAAADRMGGRPVWWLPGPRAAAARGACAAAARRRRPVLVTIGAGDVFKLGEALVARRGRAMSAPPDGVERDYPLARLTTVRTGGAADWFARPEDEEALVELLRWADGEGLPVGVIGSGSNLLVADDGFHGLAIKLDGELATIERDGERHRSAAAAPGCPRPRPRPPAGALRPRVRGQHPRHRRRRGADERQRLRRPARRGARVGRRLHSAAAATGAAPRTSASPTAARTSARRGRRPRPPSACAPADPEQVKATMAAMRERRHEAQPSGIKTFGSTFKNPDDARAEGRTRRPAARGRRLPRPARAAAPASPRSTPTSSRTPARRRPPTCSS